MTEISPPTTSMIVSMRSFIAKNSIRIISITALVLAIAAEVRRCDANDHSSCQHAPTSIFGEEVVQENVQHLIWKTRQLKPTPRFDSLAEWVLPSGCHSSIRLHGEFAGTTESAAARVDATLPNWQFRSPALDLLEVARETGKLDELRTRVVDYVPIGEAQERCRFALLACIEIFHGDISEARKLIETFEARLETQTFPDLRNRWPETLMLTVAVEQRELHDVVDAILNRILTRQIRTGTNSGPQQWDRHIAALAGRLHFLQQADDRTPAPQRFQTSPDLNNWISVSECDEATRALGFPQSHWQRSGRQINKLVCHQNDYLMYCVPLTGDYVVECDTTCFGHPETQLTIGGRWFAPHFTHDRFETGTLRGLTSLVPLDPKLSLVNDWVRYRAVVKGNVCSTYFNGRLMLTESFRENQFPWIAVRSPYFSNGSVKHVCISGTPKIPASIMMSADPELSGWARFHLDSVGGPTDDWRFDESLGPEGGIFARRKPEYDGSFQESLLRFLRPMVEDGVIEYEFFYEPGEFQVSPAIDQLVYLIERDGVVIHQATNGIYDTSDVDPLNRKIVLPRTNCPLIDGWNHVRFELTSDTVRLTLNGELVYRGEVNATNDRTFGLFHYADQSAVRVRNMKWTGAWPTKLPSPTEQELRSTELDEINAGVGALSSHITFDFTEPIAVEPKPVKNKEQSSQGYSTDSFQFHRIENHGSVEQTLRGLRMQLPGNQTYHDVWVAPRIRVTGDFDIEAEFDALKMGSPVDGTRAIGLIVVTEDSRTTHSRVWHGVYAHPGIEQRRATQVEFNRFGAGRGVTVEFEGVTAEACDSGRMRIVRIGERMSFMIAEQDSTAYRIISSTDVAAEPLRLDGIRLAEGTWDKTNPESGEVDVLWKRLEIRAENIRVIPP